MLRALWFVFLLGLLAAATMWLANNPGHVSLDWQGYVVETSAAVLVSVIVAFAILSALVYRFWIFLRGVPAGVSRHRREGRRRRGYLALTRGMVAVAAGDTGEAKRQAKRADDLLEEPSLTMLLSAQSAQLTGDEKAAENFFNEMLNNPDTEFLGLRGLLNQAMKLENHADALKWARRASRLKPESEWAARTMFDLASRDGLWTEAEEALASAVHKKHVSAADARRPRAVLSHLLSVEAETSGDRAKALKLSKKACDDAPELIPAQVRYAELLEGSGKHRKAINTLEGAWGAAPHPELAQAYWSMTGSEDAMDRMKTTQRLAGFNPKHPATSMVLARAALDARLWGDARQKLGLIGSSDEPTTNSYCQLMAELEEAEHSDMVAAREWLVRAANAEPDPTWVCTNCGNAANSWTALCGSCGGFDTFQWHRPPRVPGQIAGTHEVPKLMAADADEKEPAKLSAPEASTDIDAQGAPQ
ncbi:MAG: heme biosynthesis protein HemY [Alphaproteobacteria bacterium]|nr:heme biosynthesis protein HemY [Alphaproteobacteria bacterium]